MSRLRVHLPSLSRRFAAVALGIAVLGSLVSAPGGPGVASAATTSSRNLLTGDTVVLTSSLGTWIGTNASLRTKVWPSGHGSLVTAAKAAGAVAVQTGGPDTVRATPGAMYSGRFAVRAAGAGAPVRAVLLWYAADGSQITGDRVAGARVRDAAGSWTFVTVAGLAPARAASVALGASLPVAVAGETHYLSVPVLVSTAGGSTALAGPLRTSGNKIYDANNLPVTLRGMNRTGTFNSAPDNVTRDDIGRIKAWGANVVRITIAQHVWLPGCPTYDPATRGFVDQAITWINDLGMLAIIDLQWSAPICDTAGLNKMPDPGSTTFWQQVSARYANRPLVAFDLYNEPHDVSDAIWANGGRVSTESGVTYQAVGMRSLYTTVRKSGAQNLIFIGGLGNASSWPSTAPLTGTTNVVYAVHAYNCAQPSDCVHGTGISWLLDRFATAGKTNPIMVTEFGWPAATTLDAQMFNANVINYAEAKGWGWLAWAWDINGNCNTSQWFDLLANGTCGPGGTYQPAPAGMPILQGMSKNS